MNKSSDHDLGREIDCRDTTHWLGAYVEDAVWFTDDGGDTYSTSTTVLKKMDEAQLVENSDGLIIANMRHAESPKYGRAIATR